MPFFTRILCLLCVLYTPLTLAENLDKFLSVVNRSSPHVFISVLVTNSGYLLPNFFGYLEQLDYPKDRISVWIRTDHNVDVTSSSVNYWCIRVKKLYKSVDCHTSFKWKYPTSNPYSKPVQRYKNIAWLRQEALETARIAGADYLLTLDVDCFLTNPRTIQSLMEQNKTIIAPLLDAPHDDFGYSNFWMGKDDLGYYVSDELYRPIVKRKRLGCFSCPLVFGVVLIHLASPYSENLAYQPPHPRFLGPVNDVKQFAFSAQSEGVGLNIVNTEFYGYIMPHKTYTNINDAADEFFKFKISTLANSPPIAYSKYAKRRHPSIINSKLGLDALYVVNLARRPERKARMTTLLNELGLNYTIFNAVDGRTLNDSYIENELGIRYMKTELEEYYANDRKMRKGEVGCFVSHHTIWRKMLEEKRKTILVMEDDVDVRPYFTKGLYNVLKEANKYAPSWDFIYLGRYRVDRSGTEPRVPGTRWLVKPGHSYFMICYLLSSRGAKKLLDADPFHSLLPVDEFINLMRGTPAKNGKKWVLEYRKRNLNGYSADPLLVDPTHFDGENNYISDTAPTDEMNVIWGKIKENREVQVDNSEREKIKEKALQRQIEKIKNKRMMTRDEL